jgi:hypothetical protein
MWRRLKAGIKWILIAVAIVVGAFGFLCWRDSHRDEDFWSCSIQAQDRATISHAKSSVESSKEEDRASANLFLDACMKERGHSFIGGSRMADCGAQRIPWCYSLL